MALVRAVVDLEGSEEEEEEEGMVLKEGGRGGGIDFVGREEEPPARTLLPRARPRSRPPSRPDLAGLVNGSAKLRRLIKELESFLAPETVVEPGFGLVGEGGGGEGGGTERGGREGERGRGKGDDGRTGTEGRRCRALGKKAEAEEREGWEEVEEEEREDEGKGEAEEEEEEGGGEKQKEEATGQEGGGAVQQGTNQDKHPRARQKEAPAKAVIFSQWTGMLDLVETALEGRGWGYVRLDGGTSHAQRREVLQEFASNPRVRVMVLSLRAGGVGLNLTAANMVILLDPWW
jgi:SNF2 family DNA or RNA helicase